MRIVIVGILAALLLFLGSQLWYFYREGDRAGAELRERAADLETLRREHEALTADHEYYRNAANIEKELRSRFNYKEPGETMMIIVPRETTTSSKP